MRLNRKGKSLKDWVVISWSRYNKVFLNCQSTKRISANDEIRTKKGKELTGSLWASARGWFNWEDLERGGNTANFWTACSEIAQTDLSNFGTPRQCPSALDLLRPREQSTDVNVNAALVERICSHAESSRRNLTVEKLIRKSSQTAEDKNPLKANLVKVCRIKVPERREFVSSTRKKIFDNEGDVASAIKRRRSDPDKSYEPEERSEAVKFPVEGPRKSNRTSKPVIRYGESASRDLADVQPAPTESLSAIVNALPAELTANTSAIVDALNESTLPQLSLDDSTLNVTECWWEVLSPKDS